VRYAARVGTFYDVRGALDFDDEALVAWLAVGVSPGEPWASTSIAVGALLSALAEGDAPVNGHLVGALPVRLEGTRARWSWRSIPSEVAPEVIAASRALWRAGAPLATRGACVHRDALRLDACWDAGLVAIGGTITDVTELLPLVGELLRDDPEGVEPDIACDDIPF